MLTLETSGRSAFNFIHKIINSRNNSSSHSFYLCLLLLIKSLSLSTLRSSSSLAPPVHTVNTYTRVCFPFLQLQAHFSTVSRHFLSWLLPARNVYYEFLKTTTKIGFHKRCAGRNLFILWRRQHCV